ncbi:MAG: hypothetical protein LBU43_02390 [Candidatus Accumulibacter sp.]|jgi:hypothetical protein|nr:hypothetical protein [Accumulibacter sp.]
MNKLIIKFTVVLIVSVLTGFLIKPAFSILPAAAPVAAVVVTRTLTPTLEMIVQNTMRTMYIEMAIDATESSSWVTLFPAMNWIAQSANIIKIAALDGAYEIGIQEYTPIPPAAFYPVSSGSGILSYDKCTHDYVLDDNCCFVPADQSVDGIRHNMLSQSFYDYNTWVEMANIFFKEYSILYRGNSPPNTYGHYITTNLFEGYPLAIGCWADDDYHDAWVKQTQFYYIDWWDGSQESKKLVGGYIWPSPHYVHELSDGIKRFQRAKTGGFYADSSDPDWTPAQLFEYGKDKASPLEFQSSSGDDRVVFDASPKGYTRVLTVNKLSEEEIKLRGMTLDSYGDVYELSEEILKVPAPAPTSDLTAAQSLELAVQQAIAARSLTASAPASSGSGSASSGGESVSLELPDDYARQGEADAAAQKLLDDAGGIDDIDIPGDGVGPPNFNYRKDPIEELEDPENGPHFNWSDFTLHLSPGDSVECKPITYRAAVSSGPSHGLDSSYDLDICPYLYIIRQVLGYLVGVFTIIYIFRSFTKSSD